MNLIKIISISFLISGFLFANVNDNAIKNNKELKRGIKHIPLSKAFLSHENGGDSYASVVLSDGIGIYSTVESDYSKTIADLNAKYGEEAEKAGETLKDYVKENGTPEEKDLVDEFVYAVPNQSIIGAPCDDGDAKTGNDIYIDTNFTCVGERIYAYADKIEKIEYADKVGKIEYVDKVEKIEYVDKVGKIEYADKVKKIEYANKFLQTVYNSKIDSFIYINKVNNTYYQNKTTYTAYGACPSGYTSYDTTRCKQDYDYANKVAGAAKVVGTGNCVMDTWAKEEWDDDPGSCTLTGTGQGWVDYNGAWFSGCSTGTYVETYRKKLSSNVSNWKFECRTTGAASCPSGYSDYGDATQCRKASTILVNKSTSVGYNNCVSPWVNHDATQCTQIKAECPIGYNDNGANCVKTIQTCPSDMIEYSTTQCKKDIQVCPVNYQDIGTNCSKSTMVCPVDYQDIGANCSKSTMVCPVNYQDIGANCSKSTMVCPVNYQDIGASCSKSIMVCPDRYEDMGNNCRI